jgi:hypothetical protein
VDTDPRTPKDVLGRIFEPFFPVKEVGRGTGLGLSIRYDILTGHDGTIHTFSKPGHGARFVLTPPIAGTTRNGSTMASVQQPLNKDSFNTQLGGQLPALIAVRHGRRHRPGP